MSGRKYGHRECRGSRGTPGGPSLWRVLIRPAAVRDAEALTDLHLDVWEETYHDLIEADVLQERRTGRSDRIARRTEVHGRGVGHALLHEAIGTAPAYLWVLDGNDRAIRFYERQGFRLDGATKTEPVGVEHRMVRRGVGAS